MDVCSEILLEYDTLELSFIIFKKDLEGEEVF